MNIPFSGRTLSVINRHIRLWLQFSRPRTLEGLLSLQDRGNSLKRIDPAPFGSFHNRQDITKHGAPFLRPEAPRHLLPILALPEVSLGQVVVKTDSKVMQEQQMIGLVFPQSDQQGHGMTFQQVDLLHLRHRLVWHVVVHNRIIGADIPVRQSGLHVEKTGCCLF